MKSLFIRLLLVLAVAGMIFGTVGCETWKGAGKDVEHAGDAMQGDHK